MLSPSTRVSVIKQTSLYVVGQAIPGGAAEGKTVQGMAWRKSYMCSHSLQFKTKF